MCIIIDVNSVHKVFGNDEDFKPVKDWVIDGRGKIIFGGTTYNKEIGKLQKYTKIFAELARQKRIVRIDNEKVDQKEADLRKIEPKPEFDDPHLVALILVSKCKVICTCDARADVYLKDRRFYAGEACPRPSIFRYKNQAHLLCDDNIVNACK